MSAVAFSARPAIISMTSSSYFIAISIVVFQTIFAATSDHPYTSSPQPVPDWYDSKATGVIERQRSAEHRLHQTLFAAGRYQKNVRPLGDHGRSIKVRLGVCVMTIDEIIEKDQTMITSGCVKMKWNDEFLRWDPEDFQNLTWMALPSSEIWLPDIALINSPDPYYITRKPAFSEIAHTGDVGYYPSGRFSTRCQISLTYFPFDWQKCDLRFESWVYPFQWLYMEPWAPDPVDMKDYYRNHQWDLDRFSVTPGNITYDGLEFSTIRFSFYFRRRTLYYTVLSIFPCLIMSVLQMFSHTLPVEHPARMTLLTALFVSSSVIQSSLASQMPKSSDGVSLIQLYLMIFSTNLLISMLITFINMHVWFRVPNSPIPSCSRMLRAYFLDTGRPQQQRATATSAVAAISAATMPILGSRLPPPPQLARKNSFWQKMKRRMIVSRSEDDRLTTVTIPLARRATEGDELDELEMEDETVISAPENAGMVWLEKRTSFPSRPEPFLCNQSSFSSQEIIERRDRQGCFGFMRKSRASTSRIPGPSSGRRRIPSSPAPPPPPSAPPSRSRRGAVDMSTAQPTTLAERKDRWLQFSMLIDKVFLYAMVIYNLLCPVVIFLLVPQIQMLYSDDEHEDTRKTVYFDPANYLNYD